jgi:hypothetical protein
MYSFFLLNWKVKLGCAGMREANEEMRGTFNTVNRPSNSAKAGLMGSGESKTQWLVIGLQ